MNWLVLKALDDLYTKGLVEKNETLLESKQISFLLKTLNVIEEDRKNFIATTGFAEIYERHYLGNFIKYRTFLEQNNLLKPQTRYEESDIMILMNIKKWMDDGTLEELQKQIISSDESLRGVSQMFFKNEKYLDNKSSLIDALKKILEVESFSNEKDQQYMYRLECHSPKMIVLCENLDFLTKPNKPRQHNIELWYAGGKNVNKLDYSDNRNLPIYYSCDWDYDGLFIIYPLVRKKIPFIKLLTPNGAPKSIKSTEHNSLWKSEPIPNDEALFRQDQKTLIKQLIQNDEWIIEESNKLIDMLGVYPVN